MSTIKQRVERLNGLQSVVERKINEAQDFLRGNNLPFYASVGRVAWEPVSKTIHIGGFPWRQAPFLYQTVAAKRFMVPLIESVVREAEVKMRINTLKELDLG